MIKYFTPKELFGDDIPTWEQIDAIEDLVLHVLEPARKAWGKPIKVNSGFRSVEHNDAIGGAPNSQHMCLGAWAAADIDTGSRVDNRALYTLIRDRLPFDQLILENLGEWVHVSYRTDKPLRKMAWEAK